MNKKISVIAALLVLSTPVSIGANAINFEKAAAKEELNISELKYDDFHTMNVEEMERTKGKIGPVVAIAARGVAGGAAGVAQAYATAPNNTPSTSDIISGAVGGAVTGMTSPMGILPSGALGVSAWGMVRSVMSGGNSHGSGCSTCHAGIVK
ncbi:hypothetical protein C6H64_21945 [Photorhabdus luminescens]|uniref:hypothetical protein n=1 Tax=Photorhabdus akhurstii TaxID=171438 RepID=UPI000CF949B3|nr:hypothetical protein C6H64_21945 [Photorhabdus luminescens]PQQ27538.1 hypothetical protein C6H69_20310 [Photorhabdus luminescens]